MRSLWQVDEPAMPAATKPKRSFRKRRWKHIGELIVPQRTRNQVHVRRAAEITRRADERAGDAGGSHEFSGAGAPLLPGAASVSAFR